MDEKILFIADHLREPGNFSQLCERYGISRKTGYKWVERYHAEGVEGLEDRSRQAACFRRRDSLRHSQGSN